MLSATYHCTSSVPVPPVMNGYVLIAGVRLVSVAFAWFVSIGCEFVLESVELSIVMFVPLLRLSAYVFDPKVLIVLVESVVRVVLLRSIP